MTKFNDKINALYSREFNGVSYDIVVSDDLSNALQSVEFYDWSDTAKKLVQETAENIIDTADHANDAWEFQNIIEHDGAESCATTVGTSEGQELAGDMWSYSYEAEFQAFTIDGLIDSLLADMAQQTYSAILGLLSGWEEDEEN